MIDDFSPIPHPNGQLAVPMRDLAVPMRDLAVLVRKTRVIALSVRLGFAVDPQRLGSGPDHVVAHDRPAGMAWSRIAQRGQGSGRLA
jgi:hypothetical protein